MSKLKIITDSTWDRDNKEAEILGIKVIPLNIHFGNETFVDGVDINNESFFEKLKTYKDFPKTSQPSPETFIKIFKEELDKGNSVIYIGVDSKLSGTFNSAVIAKNELNSDKIHLIDSKTVSVGLSLLVYIAVELVKKGYDVNKLIEKINKLKTKIKVYGYVDTLEYLKKGGRLSSSQAFFGGLLNIKPILAIKNSKVESIDKARGKKRAVKKIVEIIKNDVVDTNFPLCFGSVNANEEIKKLKDILNQHVNIKEYWYQNIGGVVGSHSGPGVCAVSYISE